MVSTEGRLGVEIEEFEETKYTDVKYSLFGALAQGIKDGKEQIVIQAKQLLVIFTLKDANKHDGSFYTMLNQMMTAWDGQQPVRRREREGSVPR